SAGFFGWHAAEILTVSASVLIFFWGVFSFVSTITKRIPWLLVPCFAMLAYGYSFSMGFLNYYLSIGLACFSLAAFWRSGAGNWLTAVALSSFILLAHPIGFLWFVATIIYVTLWRAIPEYWRLILWLDRFAGFAADYDYRHLRLVRPLSPSVAKVAIRRLCRLRTRLLHVELSGRSPCFPCRGQRGSPH